jgi:hypothetical protein
MVRGEKVNVLSDLKKHLVAITFQHLVNRILFWFFPVFSSWPKWPNILTRNLNNNFQHRFDLYLKNFHLAMVIHVTIETVQSHSPGLSCFKRAVLMTRIGTCTRIFLLPWGDISVSQTHLVYCLQFYIVHDIWVGNIDGLYFTLIIILIISLMLYREDMNEHRVSIPGIIHRHLYTICDWSNSIVLQGRIQEFLKRGCIGWEGVGTVNFGLREGEKVNSQKCLFFPF